MTPVDIISELNTIHEYLTWVKEGMPYAMYGSDESSYLSSAMNRVDYLAEEIDTEGIDFDDAEDGDVEYEKDMHSTWTKCKGNRTRRIGYHYLVRCGNGFIGVATYKGREQWEGYKGFKYSDVTHFAWLPKRIKTEE